MRKYKAKNVEQLAPHHFCELTPRFIREIHTDKWKRVSGGNYINNTARFELVNAAGWSIIVEYDPFDSKGRRKDIYRARLQKTLVKNAHGKELDLSVARALMDDDLCERLHCTVDTAQDFFDAYARAHEDHYGEDFAPYVGGDW